MGPSARALPGVAKPVLGNCCGTGPTGGGFAFSMVIKFAQMVLLRSAQLSDKFLQLECIGCLQRNCLLLSVSFCSWVLLMAFLFSGEVA